jgi:uncharacterized protein (TIGR02246 family)
MSRTFFRVVFAAAVLLLAAAVPAMAQSKAAIQKLEDKWAAAFNKGDAAALTALYDGDAYVLPAGAPMAHGSSEIQSFYTQAVQQLGDIKVTTLDVKPLGRTAAREIGTATFKTKGSTPQDGALKFSAVWQKDKSDGQWKLIVDMWNFDK